MRNIYSFTVAAVLSFMTFNSSAQTISAVDSTIDSAEKKSLYWHRRRVNPMKSWEHLLRTGAI